MFLEREGLIERNSQLHPRLRLSNILLSSCQAYLHEFRTELEPIQDLNGFRMSEIHESQRIIAGP